MRFDPTQVPTSPVEIDWSHPLAEGLQGFWLPGLPPPKDLTGRYPSRGLIFWRVSVPLEVLTNTFQPLAPDVAAGLATEST